MNEVLVRDSARRLYSEREDGQLDPRYSEGDLPDYVEQRTSQGASRRSGQPWATREFDAPPASDVTANRALNRAMEQYYQGAGRGHAPGEMPSYNGNVYGETGLTDRGSPPSISETGRDPTPTRRSPPPPNYSEGGSYLSPLAAERQFRSPTSEHQDTYDPRTGWGVKPGQGRENRRVTSQGYENYGVATPNQGNPDQWTRQRGADPTPFNARGAGAGGSASDQMGLRALNNANRRRYGDKLIGGPLPPVQRADTDTEIVDWKGRRSFNGFAA